MRTKAELLTLALIYIDENRVGNELPIYFTVQYGTCIGLCPLISTLDDKKLIDKDEHDLLFKVIARHKPRTWYAKNNLTWWTPNMAEPRIKFLKRLIKIYENKS